MMRISESDLRAAIKEAVGSAGILCGLEFAGDRMTVEDALRKRISTWDVAGKPVQQAVAESAIGAALDRAQALAHPLYANDRAAAMSALLTLLETWGLVEVPVEACETAAH